MAAVDLFKPLAPQPPLSEWLDRMVRMTGHGNGQALVAETGACCWMAYYTDGYSPGEAWNEECRGD